MMLTVEQVWGEFAERLRGSISKRVSDSHAAEDILQEVFVRVSRKLGSLKDPSKLEPWVHLLARNAVIDYYRTRKTAGEVPEIAAEENPIEAGEAQELKAAFRRLVDTLPSPYREAIVATKFEGLTQKQLAENLGIPLSTAKSRIQRGAEQLKKLLLDCCRLEFDRRRNLIGCEPRHKDSCSECSG